MEDSDKTQMLLLLGTINGKQEQMIKSIDAMDNRQKEIEKRLRGQEVKYAGIATFISVVFAAVSHYIKSSISPGG